MAVGGEVLGQRGREPFYHIFCPKSSIQLALGLPSIIGGIKQDDLKLLPGCWGKQIPF